MTSGVAAEPAVLFVCAFAVVGIAAGIAIIVRAFRSLRETWTAQILPTSTVRAMALGPVELEGTIASELLVDDPVYGKPCVYFSVSVAQRVLTRTDEGIGWEWVGIHHEHTGQRPFWLQDATGRSLVWAPEADLRIDCANSYSCGLFGSIFRSPSPSLDFLRRIKKQRVFVRQVRYVLDVLRPGHRVFILGNAVAGNGFRPREPAFPDVLAAALERAPRRIITRGDGAFIIAEAATALHSGANVVARVVVGFGLAAFSFSVLVFFWFVFDPAFVG
ncbi:MAG: hypothetical protein H7125_06825 [Proteobacteria bacterium]|nr:hypothetical protein [Burkholderiales bacterium]